MILKKITSILLMTTLVSQSILPAFAMEKEEILSKKQATTTKLHNDMSPEAHQERGLVTEGLRRYLSHPDIAGVVVQPLDWILFNEDVFTAYELLKDDPSCSFSTVPLELLKDEERGSAVYIEPSVVSANRHKLSKRVIGKKDKTAAGILHYALFEDEIHILLGQRNDNGGWCNLGGESEDGETPHETASRESKEESNGIYAPHPDLLSHQPFIDTITEKNNSPFFYRMYFHNIKYLSSDVFKKKLLNTTEGHNREYTDFKWVKALDLWRAVASGNHTLQVEGDSIQLYAPLFQSLSTQSGESMLCKLWLDKKLHVTLSDAYFNIQDSFNQCYQIGNTWTTEAFFQIQKEFYLPTSSEPTDNNKTLANAVAAHGMAVVQLKRKFQEIEAPTAIKPAFWNPKCEKTLSQIHFAMVLGDQYKEPEDFKGSPNPRRAANIANIKTFINQNNDVEYWQKKNQNRGIVVQESDYDVLADILDWDEHNREWPTFIHGASDNLNNLFKAFTYLRELIGIRSLNQLVATRGTDIYFKKDKTIWDMINRTGPVEDNETRNAMMFFNFVLFATHTTTVSTSSSVEYFTGNHSVNPQDMSARFQEAMALCGFSKPDYSYFHSLFEQFYKYQHPTFENSVLIAVSQNPETLDDYNYPTPGGGSFIFTDYQHQTRQSTSQFVHAIQSELEHQWQREQKLQWEFEHPLDHESTGKYSHAKPKAQASRVRFDSFKNDTTQKKSMMPENRRFLQPDTFLNLNFVRTCAFDRFPLSEREKQAYDAEMRKTTVHIVADWLAEHTQGIPGSFTEIPMIKTIYAMAYEKITGEKPEESLPIDGFIYLAQNSNKETVEGFIVTCMDIFESKKEILPLPMVLNFLPALVKHGNPSLFSKILKKYPEVDLNKDFPNINYCQSFHNIKIPIFNVIDKKTPNFSDIVKMLIEKGVNKIQWGLNEDLSYKILNELILYPQDLKGDLQAWFNVMRNIVEKEAQCDFAKLLNAQCFNLTLSLLDKEPNLKIASYLYPDGLTALTDVVKSHKTLRSLKIGEQLLPSSQTKLLAEGLKKNATLEELILPTKEMFEVMGTLAQCQQGAFQAAPWFQKVQSASYTSLDTLQAAITNKNWSLLTDWVKKSTIEHLDFTQLNLHYMVNEWMSPLLEGLKDNATLCTLILPEDWQLPEIMMQLISSPEGPFTKAPWFCNTWQEALKNPGKYLEEAAYNNNDRAISAILKNAHEEIELSKHFHSFGIWFNTLVQELSQDEPYFWLNLSGMLISPTCIGMLANALKTNTKLKSLNLKAKYPDNQKEAYLAEGLKANTTLEALSLSNEQMISVMGYLMESQDDASYRRAPWFTLTWEGIIGSPEKNIKLAFENAGLNPTKNQNLIRQIVCETNVKSLDLSNISKDINSNFSRNWIKPIMEGLGSHKTIQQLKVQLDDSQLKEDRKNLITMLQNNSCLTYLNLEVMNHNYYGQLNKILCALKEIDSLSLTVLDLSDCKGKLPDFCLESLKSLSNTKPDLKITIRFWG